MTTLAPTARLITSLSKALAEIVPDKTDLRNVAAIGPQADFSLALALPDAQSCWIFRQGLNRPRDLAANVVVMPYSHPDPWRTEPFDLLLVDLSRASSGWKLQNVAYGLVRRGGILLCGVEHHNEKRRDYALLGVVGCQERYGAHVLSPQAGLKPGKAIDEQMLVLQKK